MSGDLSGPHSLCYELTVMSKRSRARAVPQCYSNTWIDRIIRTQNKVLWVRTTLKSDCPVGNAGGPFSDLVRSTVYLDLKCNYEVGIRKQWTNQVSLPEKLLFLVSLDTEVSEVTCQFMSNLLCFYSFLGVFYKLCCIPVSNNYLLHAS